MIPVPNDPKSVEEIGEAARKRWRASLDAMAAYPIGWDDRDLRKYQAALGETFRLAQDGIIVSVPNAPKTPHSSFRIPPELKAEAKVAAEDLGTDLTAIVIKAFEDAVKKANKKRGAK